MTSFGKTLAQSLAAIEALDLGPIKFKAMLSVDDDGYGWSAERTEHAATSYKRQLILSAKHPQATLVPDRDTDRFWHLHILDTMKYAADCDAIFGHFIHHHPGFGLRGVDDERAAREAFAATQRLLAEEFGEAAPDASAWCAKQAAGEQAAWCAKQQAAWCAKQAAGTQAAWCAKQAAGTQAAWCAKQAAWCAKQAADEQAAWCAKQAAGMQAAWCAKQAADEQAAWCAKQASTEAEQQAERLAA